LVINCLVLAEPNSTKQLITKDPAGSGAGVAPH
jgi:hypothetical protein